MSPLQETDPTHSLSCSSLWDSLLVAFAAMNSTCQGIKRITFLSSLMAAIFPLLYCSSESHCEGTSKQLSDWRITLRKPSPLFIMQLRPIGRQGL